MSEGQVWLLALTPLVLYVVVILCLMTNPCGPKDWQYFDYPDVYRQRRNLRYSPSTDRIQLLDVDGWCDPMPAEQAYRLYGMTREQQRAAIRRLRDFVDAP